MKPSPYRRRVRLLVTLISALATAHPPAIAEWRIETGARVPGETGLTEIFPADDAREAARPARAAPAPRYASGIIHRAPVVEAGFRPVASILAAAPAVAGDSVARDSAEPALPLAAAPLLASADRVDDGTLDTLRGGFETPGGLQLSFGIERLVYVNGELSSVTSINVSDLNRLTGASAAAIAGLPANGSIALIQNGVGNTFSAGQLSASALATVIQNSLDNQHIQAVTTISATVNSMEMLKAIRLQQTLEDALSGSLSR